jgi:alpha-D-xyloside xylohydrolase
MSKTITGVRCCQLGESESITPVKLYGAGAVLELGHDNTALPFNRKDIVSQKTRRGFIVEIPMKNNEDFYGFGLQFHAFNQANRRRFMKVNSDPLADTGESHAPVPFYVSTAGYGLLVDTFRYATFYTGTNGARGSSKSFGETKKNYDEFSEQSIYALKQARNDRHILIEIPNCAGVDLYFFEGPSMLDAIRRYNIFSGGGCLPPLWALGNWYRAYGGSDQEHILKLAEVFRQSEIPVNVLGLEPGWHSHSYSCTYLWNENLFPEPDMLIQKLKALGYHINLWEHAFIHPLSELYEILESRSADYEVWGGVVPDFADKTTRDAFSKYHKKNFIDRGITGFKLDECDNSDFNQTNWSFPELSSFPSGLDGEQMHSAMGLLYQKTIEQAFREQGMRTLGQARSSWALAAKSPFVLYSDLYDHRQFVRALVNSGFSGLLWSPEVRSCEDAEDLIRRLQTTVFSPQSLLNCWRISNPPWFQTNTEKNLAGEQMEGSEYITGIAKKYLDLRMQILPYLYSAFFRYYAEGLPPLRALVLDYEKDQCTHSIDDQYMFGDSLMVAPMFKGQTTRAIFLPKGEWYDFWTHIKFEGSQIVNFNAPLEIIPVFVKSGSIIPLAQTVQFVKSDTIFDITAFCFGGGEKDFTLYEDDGISLAHETGRFNRLIISQNTAGEISVMRNGTEQPRYNILEWKFIE